MIWNHAIGGKKKTAISTFVFLLATGSFVGLAGELFLRIYAPIPVNSGRLFKALSETPDGRERNWSEPLLIPGAIVTHGGVSVRINSLGLRGEETERKKGMGVLRIAMFGDSFVYGFGVKEENTLPRQLQARLRERYSGVEVLNFGVVGMNTFQEMMYALQYGMSFDPDLVVLVWFHNDVELLKYSLNDLETFKINGRLDEPEKGRKMRARAEKPRSQWAVQRKKNEREEGRGVWSFVKSHSRLIKILFEPPVPMIAGSSKRDREKRERDEALFMPSYSDGLRLSSLSIEHLNQEFGKKGVELFVFLYPQMDSFKPGYRGDRAYRDMEAFGNRQKLKLHNLYPWFAGRNPGQFSVSRTDAHPNGAAHRIVSRAMEELLTERSDVLLRERYRLKTQP